MTHSISIWPLTADEEFADSLPAFESNVVSEDEARQLFAGMTYDNASELDEWKAAPAYLVSLDKPDDDGIGICQEQRVVRPNA
jgi:hypothetical protein